MEFLKEFVNFIILDDLSAIPIVLIILFIMMGIDSKRVEENERRRTKRAPDVCRATDGAHVWVTADDYGEVCGPCGIRR